MSRTAHLEALYDRWQKLGLLSSQSATAHFFGGLLGMSASKPALSPFSANQIIRALERSISFGERCQSSALIPTVNSPTVSTVS